MRLEVARLDINTVSPEEFFVDFFEPEKPVILSGFDPAMLQGLQKKIWDIAHTGAPAGGNGYYAAPIGLGEGSLPVPDLVKATFARTDIVHKPQPLRLWMQPEGQQTGLHYDGNSLCGLNWHVIGRKHWLLVAPTRLLPMKPLTYLTITPDGFDPDPEKYDVMEFVVEPGEMLYIPRYWAHRVTAQGPQHNANLNWVWTRKHPNLSCPVGLREAAALKFRRYINYRLDRLIAPRVSLNNYGDGGPDMFKRYTTPLTMSQLMKFTVRECWNLMLMPLRGAAVKRRQTALDQNNFPETLRPQP